MQSFVSLTLTLNVKQMQKLSLKQNAAILVVNATTVKVRKIPTFLGKYIIGTTAIDLRVFKKKKKKKKKEKKNMNKMGKTFLGIYHRVR